MITIFSLKLLSMTVCLCCCSPYRRHCNDHSLISYCETIKMPSLFSSPQLAYLSPEVKACGKVFFKDFVVSWDLPVFLCQANLLRTPPCRQQQPNTAQPSCRLDSWFWQLLHAENNIDIQSKFDLITVKTSFKTFCCFEIMPLILIGM